VLPIFIDTMEKQFVDCFIGLFGLFSLGFWCGDYIVWQGYY
jgi:hypothetical protein